MSCKNINVTQERQERRPAEAAEYRVLNGFGETQPGVAFPVRGANPWTDSQFPANCAGNLVSVPGLRRTGYRLE